MKKDTRAGGLGAAPSEPKVHGVLAYAHTEKNERQMLFIASHGFGICN